VGGQLSEVVTFSSREWVMGSGREAVLTRHTPVDFLVPGGCPQGAVEGPRGVYRLVSEGK
jgi:hypothetical protein